MARIYYDTEEPPNYSVYAIAVYWVLSMLPHFYGLYILSKANNWTYDNIRPRTPEVVAKLQAAVPAATWAQYKKLEELHRNSLENFPLLIAAVVLGTISGWTGSSIHCLNLYISIFLELRVVYAFLYLHADNQVESWFRTVAWLGSVGVLLFQILSSAGQLKKEYAIHL